MFSPGMLGRKQFESGGFFEVRGHDGTSGLVSDLIASRYCNLTSGNLVCVERPGLGEPSTGAIHHWYSMEF